MGWLNDKKQSNCILKGDYNELPSYNKIVGNNLTVLLEINDSLQIDYKSVTNHFLFSPTNHVL